MQINRLFQDTPAGPDPVLLKSRVYAAIMAEPELPHGLSDPLYEKFTKLDKEKFEALLRGVIAMAKSGITDRIEKGFDEGRQP